MPLPFRHGRGYDGTEMDDDPQIARVLGFVGANIKRLRTKRGLTQEALASGASMDLRFLQRLEYGQTNVGVAVLVKVSEVLGVKPGVLLKETEPAPKAKRGRPRKRPVGGDG